MSKLTDAEVFELYFYDPFIFIEDMWGLIPQWNQEDEFIKGRHLTWQQVEVIQGVKDAVNPRKRAKKRLAVSSGHGIGKSGTLAMIILWFLFTRKNCNIPATAPTSQQIYDILWKECAKWIRKMPEDIKNLYEWNTGYIRIKENPAEWFASARTARKEKPEALAGFHAEHILYIVDEASGVHEEIYRTAEGGMTQENALILMCSNPTKDSGYFFDAFHKDKKSWQRFMFSSLDSPLVDMSYVERIRDKHGEDSDEYRIRVRGKFPKEGAVDKKGYMKLFLNRDIDEGQVEDETMIGELCLGVDPSGMGPDETIITLRSDFKARIIFVEKKSSPKNLAGVIMTLAKEYNVFAENITVDSFGEGAKVVKELALNGYNVNAINVGEICEDKEDHATYINIRARACWDFRSWVKKGGQFVRNDKWEECKVMKYRRVHNGKLKAISKDELRDDGIKSPNVFDATMLTFVFPIKKPFDEFDPAKEFEEDGCV